MNPTYGWKISCLTFRVRGAVIIPPPLPTWSSRLNEDLVLFVLALEKPTRSQIRSVKCRTHSPNARVFTKYVIFAVDIAGPGEEYRREVDIVSTLAYSPNNYCLYYMSV